MAEEAAIPLSPPSPAGQPARGTALLTVASLLMWTGAISEAYLWFNRHGSMAPGLPAVMTSSMIRHIIEPAIWARMRLWARICVVALILMLAYLSLSAFLLWSGEIAQAARNSFHGIRLEVFLCLPAGLAGLILTFIVFLQCRSWRKQDSISALTGIWILLPYLFPVGVTLLIGFVARRRHFFLNHRTHQPGTPFR